MALTHTIMVPLFQSVSTNQVTVLAIQQGGHTPILTRQQMSNASLLDSFCRMCFTWKGDVYIPTGGGAAMPGWSRYNQGLNQFETVDHMSPGNRIIPLLDRVGFFCTGNQGWGYDPTDKRASVSVNSQYAQDYAVSGSSVVIVDKLYGFFRTWAYPFTSPPAQAGSTLAYSYRLCELGGKIYTVNLDTTTQAVQLYDVSNGYPALVGTPTAGYPVLNYWLQSTPARQILFKFNGKLFYAATNNTNSQQRVRLWEINPVTGTSVEQTPYLPTAWQAIYAGTDGSIFEVRDDITPNEQVFLFWHSGAAWECYEFVEGVFQFVDSGTDQLLRGAGGVVYDPTAKAAQINSAVDSVPSNYVTTKIETFDKYANGTVDIDPRYRWNKSESPPYPQCTDMGPGSGSEGVTGLSTKPSGITTLANLSDDFEDNVINPNLWERIDLAFGPAMTRDYGHGYYTSIPYYILQEINGAIRFGRTSGETPAQYTGIGVRSKWRLNGAFQLDFIVANPERLTLSSGFGQYYQVVLVRTGTNEGYGFVIWRSSTGPTIYVRGLYAAPNSFFAFSSDVTGVVDGTTIRIARDASNNWSVRLDPTGSNTDIMPAGSSYSEPVEIVMGAATSTGVSWILTGTVIGNEPGIKNLSASGAGSLGLYQGGVEHDFMWDHVTDLGVGQNGAAELFVDTQRT